MKKIVLVLAVLAAALMGCQNVVNPPAGKPAAGTGRVEVRIGDGVARTALPAAPTLVKYGLSLQERDAGDTADVGSPVTSEINNGTTDSLELSPGWYKLTVTGYLANDKIAARGTSALFQVYENITTPVSVGLNAVITEGQGTIGYTVNLTGVTGLAAATLTIGSNPATSIDLLNGGAANDSIALNPGTYLVELSLSKGAGYQAITRGDMAHVYSNLDTPVSFTITDANFTDFVEVSGTATGGITYILAYLDADYSTYEGLAEVAGGAWTLYLPTDPAARDLYFIGLEAVGTGEYFTTATQAIPAGPGSVSAGAIAFTKSADALTAAQGVLGATITIPWRGDYADEAAAWATAASTEAQALFTNGVKASVAHVTSHFEATLKAGTTTSSPVTLAVSYTPALYLTASPFTAQANTGTIADALNGTFTAGNGYTLVLSAGSSPAQTLSTAALTGKTLTVRGAEGGTTASVIQLTGQGSLFTVESGVSLVLDKNITLQGVNPNTAALVTVSGGNFTMKNNAAIIGNIRTNNDATAGGGVTVEAGGQFGMEGGVIGGSQANQNQSNNGGGGVLVSGKSAGGVYSKVTMSGGEISYNTIYGSNDAGGGVRVAGVSGDGKVTNTTFEMTGGSIHDNTALNYGGGIFAQTEGIIKLLGNAVISHNTANTAGGGVGLYNGVGAALVMSGSAKISDNTATLGGGVLISVASTLDMSGNAVIETNHATNGAGGGVNMQANAGAFTMSGSATVRGNDATTYGGGVHVIGPGSSFTMNGGTIDDNHADIIGGGVMVYNATASFTMTGGSINGNTATQGGKGVYVNTGCTIKLSGGALINANNPVEFMTNGTSSGKITVAGALTQATAATIDLRYTTENAGTRAIWADKPLVVLDAGYGGSIATESAKFALGEFVRSESPFTRDGITAVGYSLKTDGTLLGAPSDVPASNITYAWVTGHAIASSATTVAITRTAGTDNAASHAIFTVTTPADYTAFAWTVNNAAAGTGSTFDFDATWQSNGTYYIGLAVTKGGVQYSKTFTVTVAGN